MKKIIQLNEKIFIAGANGMAGGAIYRKLLDNGYGQIQYGGEILTPTREELNLLDKEAVRAWFQFNKPSVVVLAAAKVGGILANSTKPTDFLLDNLKIQINVIETAWLSGVKRLLFLGSSCIYPKFAKQPIKEEYLLNSELEPTNQWYAIAKIAGIKLCESLRIQHGFDAISIMPTNLYGPKDNYDIQTSHVFAAFIKRFSEAANRHEEEITCWGSGLPLREFLHVDDLGEAVVFALEYWDPSSSNAPLDNKGNPLFYLNVGTGIDISIKTLANRIAEESCFKGNIVWDKNKPDGTPRKLLDVSRLKELGWESKISIDDGIKKTLESFRKEHPII